MVTVDCHAHLDFPEFGSELDAIIDRASFAGVRAIITAGTDVRSSEACIRIAEKHPFVYATVGIHPHDASKADEAAFATLESLCHHPKVKAIGEIGLDYHYDKSPREVQKQVFSRLLTIAKTQNLPVVIHGRSADAEALAMVQEAGISKAFFHCFTGPIEVGHAIVRAGYFIGATGIITFNDPSNANLIKQFPIANLLTETDAPFLSPKPFRGKRNEPCHIAVITDKLSQIFGMAPPLLKIQLMNNAIRFFDLPEVAELQ